MFDLRTDPVAFDGQYLYGSELEDIDSVLHRVAVPDGTPESVHTVKEVQDAFSNYVESAIVDKLSPALTHLDFTEEPTVAADPKPLFRLELETRTVRSLHPLTTAGALLTSDGDVSYVRAAPHPLPLSGDWSDRIYTDDGVGRTLPMAPRSLQPFIDDRPTNGIGETRSMIAAPTDARS